jgi:uncharacterized protein YndB with AHSA1/START domain
MTEARKLKKAIRARARKTGESYSAARRSYLKPPPPPPAATKTKPRTAGGLSDAKAIEHTGHGLDHWFAVLDRYSQGKKGHTGAARHLAQDHAVPMWYCQGITVAWERARGHRAMNQSCEGDFQVSVSRVVPLRLAELFRLVGDTKERSRWLRDADPALVRALTAAFVGGKSRGLRMVNPRRARLRYRWEPGVVEIALEDRPGGDKSTIVASNEGLPDAATMERRRALWKDALDALRRHLAA